MKIFTIILLVLLSIRGFTQNQNIIQVSNTIGCKPLEVSFQTDLQNVISYEWNFGNGTGSKLANPVIIYRDPGYYDITLIVEYSDHSVDTIYQKDYIKVIEKSVADFVLKDSILCDHVEVSFLNNSVDADTFLWDFGDGNSSTDKNPKHLYTEPGEYTVSLIAYNEYGCGVAHVKEKLIHIEELEFNANKTIGCEYEKIAFEAEGDYVNYVWDFGDGKQSSVSYTEHTYDEPGIYDVTLTVQDDKGCTKSRTKKQFIHIRQSPEFDINLSDSITCLGDEISFSIPTAENENVLWNFSDGFTSSEDQFTRTFNNIGSYDIQVTYKNASGCIATKNYEKAVVVSEAKAPLFETSDFTGCAPFNFNIKNVTPGAVGFTWEIDNKIFNGKTLTYSFDKSGEYTLKAFTQHENGCTSAFTFNEKIVVHNTINQIKATVVEGCVPLYSNLTLKDNNVTSVKWDLGNGQTSDLPEAKALYSEPGNYAVKVSYEDQFGCQKNLELDQPVAVYDTSIDFSTPPVIYTCSNAEVYFYGGMGNDFWEWNFGDGSSSNEENPVHNYDNPGKYIVSLRTNNSRGCKTTIPVYNEINYSRLDAKVDYTVKKGSECPDFSVVFNAELNDSESVLWSFNDGTSSRDSNHVHQFTSTGNIQVNVITSNANGCSVSKALLIQSPWISCAEFTEIEDEKEKEDPEQANKSHKISSCDVPFEVSFSNPFPDALNVQWTFGDGKTSTAFDPVHTYTETGTFYVDYFAEFNNGRTKKLKEYVTVNVKDPAVDFNYEIKNTCTGIEAEFLPVSSNLKDFSWKFSDGSRFTDLNIKKSYMDDRVDQVILSATDSNGCIASTVKNVVIGNPHIKFDYDKNICLGESVKFDHNINGFEEFRWIFKEGSTSEDISPQHIFETSGIHHVLLEAKDHSGCIKTLLLPEPVTVNNPVADFDINGSGYGCNQLKVQFKNKSTDAGEWHWDFGNGKTSDSKNPEISFSPGIYTISLKAVKNGCENSITRDSFIKVDELIADFTIEQESTCIPSEVAFKNKSKYAKSWHWEFGDGKTSKSENPVHYYSDYPANKAKLTITNNKGCKVSKTVSLNFFRPKFSVDDNNGCLPFQVQFNDETKAAVSWHWDFGDGNSSSLQNPGHTYTEKGTYDVSLKAKSSEGCISTYVKKNFIQVEEIKAAFTSKVDGSICVPLLVNFIDSSLGATDLEWDFGDEAKSKIKNPLHVYSKVGNFDVKLVVTNDLGCRDSVVLENHITTKGPQTDFAISDTIVCNPKEVQFTDLSSSAVSWQWFFGDGSTSSLQNPVHHFENPGIYSISLLSTDESGCKQIQSFDSLKVYPTPQADFDLEVSDNCLPVKIKAINRSKDLMEESFTWDFGNGKSSSAFNPTYSFNKPGVYLISLKTTNGSVCNDRYTYPEEIVVRDTFNLKEPVVRQLSVNDNADIEILTDPYTRNNLIYHIVYRKADTDPEFQVYDTLSPATHIYKDLNAFTWSHAYQYVLQSHTYCSKPSPINELTAYNSIKLSAVNIKNKAVLEWNKYKGHQFDHYAVQRKRKGKNWQLVKNINPDQLTFTDQEDLCPDDYEYRVIAKNLDGLDYHSTSNIPNVFINTDFTRQEVNVIRTTVLDDTRILTEWKEPEFGLSQVAFYQVLKSVNDAPYIVADTVAPGITSYIDEFLNTDEEIYSYKIKVFNSCDINTRFSNAGNSISLKKETKYYKNRLYWNSYKGWNDGVQHYLLQKQNDKGEWETIGILDEGVKETDVDLE